MLDLNLSLKFGRGKRAKVSKLSALESDEFKPCESEEFDGHQMGELD